MRSRIAAAVESLVVLKYQVGGTFQEVNLFKNAISDVGMLADFHPLFLGEFPRLEENLVGNTDFADVVQQRATLNVHKLVLRDADLARHQQRVVTDSLGVSLSLMFTSIQGTDERFKRMSVGTLDLPQCCL